MICIPKVRHKTFGMCFYGKVYILSAEFLGKVYVLSVLFHGKV